MDPRTPWQAPKNESGGGRAPKQVLRCQSVRYGALLYMLEQVRTSACSRNRHRAKGKGGRWLASATTIRPSLRGVWGEQPAPWNGSSLWDSLLHSNEMLWTRRRWWLYNLNVLNAAEPFALKWLILIARDKIFAT